MKNSKRIIISFTRREAESLGLLVCECGYPKNNHFDFDEKVCAHTTKCTGYKEIARNGKLINENENEKMVDKSNW